MKKTLFQFDWWLIVPVLFLIIIGSTVLFSINPVYFENQLFGILVSLFVFVIVSQISYKDFRHFSVPLYLLVLILLVIVFIIGFESRGAVRWVEVFGTSLQASEIGKPLLALAFAGFLSQRSNRHMKTYILALLYLIPVVFLIYYQPDLGNALLYVGVFLITLIIYGMPLLWFFIGMLPFIIGAPFFWNFLHDYQRQRVFTFFNPLSDPSGSSYNLIQAIITVGSGMLIGKGIGEGTQSRLRFLPENHTDFIFASLAEKLGFFGSLLVLILYIFLLYRMYVVLINCKDMFGRIIVASSFLFLLLHFFVNIGMNLGLVPVVGVTLPFISYGGSSMLANSIMLGIISSISVRNCNKDVLEIR